jgi:hypothetical protein
MNPQQADNILQSALKRPKSAMGLIHDIGEQDGEPFIVMEHLEGATLKERIQGPMEMATLFPHKMRPRNSAGCLHIPACRREIRSRQQPGGSWRWR